MNISNEVNQECPFKSSEKVLIGKMRKINFCYQKKGKEAEEETRITRAENTNLNHSFLGLAGCVLQLIRQPIQAFV